MTVAGPTHQLLIAVCNEIDEHPHCPSCGVEDPDDDDFDNSCEVCGGAGRGSQWMPPDRWRPLMVFVTEMDDRLAQGRLVFDVDEAPRQHAPAPFLSPPSPLNDEMRAALHRAGDLWLSMARGIYVAGDGQPDR